VRFYAHQKRRWRIYLQVEPLILCGFYGDAFTA
jgi:hypothetical protein